MTGLSTSECGMLCEFRVDDGAVLEGSAVPIGYPVPDKQLMLLDDAGNEVAPGEVGEISVRSEFLALGYWGRPEAGAKVFLPDPTSGPGRICRTGDLGRMRPDGCYLHLGRKDGHAKLRGRFVDAGEIENALLDHPALAGAAVSIREDRPGGQRLVAHVVARRAAPTTVSELQQFVRERLGDHLVPSAFVFLDELPRTPNGKVDRRALPAPGRSRPVLAQPFAPPRTPLETAIAGIWSTALGLDEVGILDAFLELGGTSLVAGRITTAVVERFGVPLPIRALLEARTVEAMAAAVVAGLLETVAPDAAARLDAIDPADLR
jgi:AMP-binding enzyme/phosphopantetheine binding protein